MFTQDSDATTEWRGLYIVGRGDLGRGLGVECISSLVSRYTEADGVIYLCDRVIPASSRGCGAVIYDWRAQEETVLLPDLRKRDWRRGQGLTSFPSS